MIFFSEWSLFSWILIIWENKNRSLKIRKYTSKDTEPQKLLRDASRIGEEDAAV